MATSPDPPALTLKEPEKAQLTRQPNEARSGSWFPGLDGVRALAVLLVFAVHYVHKGYVGWTGVIVFFVLSGFLITGVLYDSRNEPRRFINFYVRRSLRIFPLFYFIWFLVAVGALFLREQWQPILILWPIYLGNFARFFAGTIAVDHIYTRFPAVPIEIGHFWSLAVEEQFYLLWPLVVFKVLDRRKLIRICLGVMAAVLLLRMALIFVVPAPILEMGFFFRMAFMQADAFLFGGLLALLLRGPQKERVLRSGIWMLYGSLAGIAMICWINNAGKYLSKFVPETPWVSAYGFTLVYLISGGLILCSLRSETFLSRVLSLPPLRLLGRYSYGFYVYHVLLAPVLWLYLGRSSAVLTVSASIVTEFLIVFAISAISYRFLEKPFLHLKQYFSGPS